MTARSWAVPGRVVFTVTDRDELASGTYLLEVDSSGEGVCTRVAPEEAGGVDLSLSVSALGSLWLGGGAGIPALSDLVLRDEATPTDPSDATRLATMFDWPVPPHALTDF